MTQLLLLFSFFKIPELILSLLLILGDIEFGPYLRRGIAKNLHLQEPEGTPMNYFLSSTIWRQKGQH